MIFTTRTLSTLKFLGLGGMTARAASATNGANRSSFPYCFEAIAGLSARVREACVNGLGSVCTDRAVEEANVQFVQGRSEAATNINSAKALMLANS